MKKNDKPITVVQIFDLPKEKVWKSITELSEMIKWYFENIPEFEARVGFKTQFNIVNNGRNFQHNWLVTEVKENEKIVYNWQYMGYQGSMDVIFQLFDFEDSTKLEVRVNILEDFPENIPEFSRESCKIGWKYFINESLNNYLSG